MVEFALSAVLLFLVFAGTFQYGYTFYVYNELQSAVRNGVRYASLSDYYSNTPSCVSTVTTAVQNMTVYGTDNPPAGAQPIAPGLATSNISVAYNTDSNGVPSNVSVSVTNFSVDALFHTFTFNGKPFATMPWTGRFAPDECP